MATSWVLGKVSDALAPTVSGVVSTAGGFAGGAVNAVGNSINGVGDGINRSIKAYGDGAKDYGNSIMDWTKADGGRGATAANPLGLGSGVSGGKRNVTSPSVYHAPKSTPSKTLMTTSKSAAPQKKIGAAPATKTAPKGPTAVKKDVSKPAAAKTKPPAGPNPGALRGGGTNAVKKTPVNAKKPVAAKTTPVTKPAAPKANAASYGSSKTAANPIGISW